MKKTTVLVFFALIIIALPALHADENWVKFTSDDPHEGMISVKFPDTPVHKERKIDTVIGQIVANVYVSEIENTKLAIGFIKVPAEMLDYAGREKVYNLIVSIYLEENFGTKESYEDFTSERRGLHGKVLHYRLPPSAEGHPGYHGKAQLYLDGTLLFTLNAIKPLDQPDTLIDRFYDSLEVVEEREWSRFRSNEDDEDLVSILMPGKPALTESTSKSPLGKVSSHNYTGREQGANYVASYSTLPRFAVTLAGSDTIFANAKESVLTKAFADEDSYLPNTRDGWEGMKLTYRTNAVRGKPSFGGRAEFYLQGRMLYVFNAILPVTIPDSYIDRYFDSLTIQE